MVIPRSRSSSFESMTRSTISSLALNIPLCRSIASTSVVFPWSTCAMMAMFRVVALGITIHHNKGDFEIGRILRLKSEIRNVRLDALRAHSPVQFKVSDLGFEMQDSSNFKISPLSISLQLDSFPQKPHCRAGGIISIHELPFPASDVASRPSGCSPSSSDAATTAGTASGPRLDYGIHRQDGNRRPCIQ